jgi:hypothetical protein
MKEATQTTTPTRFEAVPHLHRGMRMTKTELAFHLTTPHRLGDGGWISNCGPASAISKWRREEMDATHREYHEGAGA